MSTIWVEATQGADLETILVAAQADGESAEEVATCLACTDRFDLLEQLKDHPVYGDEAKKELLWKKQRDEGKRIFEEKVAAYPEPIKRFHELVKTSPQLGYFGVSYPSVQAQQHGLGDNYLAIMGDGLFLFMLEIVEQQFRICHNPNKDKRASSVRALVGDDEKKFVAATGKTYGDLLNEEEVVEALKETFNIRKEEK